MSAHAVADFQALFEAAPDLYLVLGPPIGTPSDFPILGASNAYLEATMTRREDIVGHTLFEIFSDNPADPSATRGSKLRASLERVVRDKKPDRMDVGKYDLRRPNSDRGDFEERDWSLLNTPVLGDRGQLCCIIHRVEDVTERVG